MPISIRFRTPKTRRRPWVCAGMLLLIAFGLSACGHARLAHFDGTPFVEHGPRLALDNGWVAMDSCATGYHAVMFMDVDAVHAFPILPRWIHANELGALRDLRLEGPWCQTDYQGFYEAYDDLPWRQKDGASHVKEHCIYRVRAEYTLAPSSMAADSLYLAHFQDVVSRSDH